MSETLKDWGLVQKEPHKETLRLWYAACATDPKRTQDEETAMLAVGAILAALGVVAKGQPVPREGK